MDWCGSEGSLHSRKLLLHRVLIPSVLLFCLPSKLVARCPIITLLTLPLICSTNDSNPLNGVQKQHLPITAPYPNLGFLLWLAAGELFVAFREKWPKSRGIKKKGQFFMQKKDEVWTNFENLNRPHTLWSSFCKSYALKGILTALHTYENTYIHTSLTANLSIIKAKGISSPYPIIPIGFSIKRYLTLLKQTNKKKKYPLILLSRTICFALTAKGIQLVTG